MDIEKGRKGIEGYVSGGRSQRLAEARSLLLTLVTSPSQIDADGAKEQLLDLDRRLAHRGNLSAVRG